MMSSFRLGDFLNVIDEKTTLNIHLERQVSPRCKDCDARQECELGFELFEEIEPHQIPIYLTLKTVKSIEVGVIVDFDVVVR